MNEQPARWARGYSRRSGEDSTYAGHPDRDTAISDARQCLASRGVTAAWVRPVYPGGKLGDVVWRETRETRRIIMTVWQSPSGRLHQHSGGDDDGRFRKTRVSEADFGVAERCQCLAVWRPDEAWKGEAREAYADIAQELDGPEKAADVLAMLDVRAVTLARVYAKRNHQRWPPRPARDVPTVSIWTL